MADAQVAANTRAAMQDYRNLLYFLSESVWSALASEPQPSHLQAINVVVTYLVNDLGLRHPTEPTMAVVAALVGARSSLRFGLQLQSVLGIVKSVMKTVTTRARQAGLPLPAGRYLLALPENSEGLPADFLQHVAPQGFANVPDGFDGMAIMNAARAIPLRNTHRDLQLQRQLDQPPSGVGLALQDPRLAGMNMVQTAQMAQAAVAMANALAGSRESSAGLLSNLQIFPDAQRQANPARQSMQALLDRAQDPPVTAQAVAQAEASQPVVHASQPVVIESAAPVEAVALEDMKQPAVAPSEAVEDQMASGSVEQKALADKAVDLQCEPPQVKDAMARLAKSYYNKDLPDADETGGYAAKRRGRPSKRPATALEMAGTPEGASEVPLKRTAGGTKVLKRPAAASVEEPQMAAATQKLKPAAKPKVKAASPKKKSQPAAKPKGKVASQKTKKAMKKEKELIPISLKARIKKRPQGCPSCRETRGCCPSCWKRRGYLAQ